MADTERALSFNLEQLQNRYLRERAARKEVEMVAEQALHDLYEVREELRQRNANLKLLHSVARAAHEARTLGGPFQVALDQICAHTGWPVGHAYLLNEGTQSELASMGLWHLDAPERFKLFRLLSERARIPRGIGLPGMVWESGKPAWIPNVAEEGDFPRAKIAAEVGLRSGFGFPVLVRLEVQAVLEFFSPQSEAPKDPMLEIMGLVGAHLGPVLERMRSEARLKHRARDLIRSNAELEQFTAVASHDLQEPLRSITSFLQLLQKKCQDKLDPEGEEYIRYAVSGAHRLKALIVDLLSYSRVHRWSQPQERVDLTDVVHAALKNLRSELETSAAQVTWDKLPVVTGFRSLLVDLFQNLLDNAMKYRSAAPPRIHISAYRRVDHWEVAVQDNGIGIDPQYHSRLFRIFQRLHGGDGAEGTGVGLATARKIVERHGGRIGVKSEAGRGATFTFTLPVKPSAAMKDEEA